MILLFFWNQQGVAYTPITSTTVLHLPVDCVLADDHETESELMRPGRAQGKMLRRIFRE